MITLGGAALAAAGLFTCLITLGSVTGGHESTDRRPAFDTGLALGGAGGFTASIGAAWLSYARGLRRGVSEARAALEPDADRRTF
jgi:hypothetical protein